MAGRNVIAHIDARFAELSAKIDAQGASYGHMIGVLIGLLGTAVISGIVALFFRG